MKQIIYRIINITIAILAGAFIGWLNKDYKMGILIMTIMYFSFEIQDKIDELKSKL